MEKLKQFYAENTVKIHSLLEGTMTESGLKNGYEIYDANHPNIFREAEDFERYFFTYNFKLNSETGEKNLYPSLFSLNFELNEDNESYVIKIVYNETDSKNAAITVYETEIKINNIINADTLKCISEKVSVYLEVFHQLSMN